MFKKRIREKVLRIIIPLLPLNDPQCYTYY